jgi:hypothetical protein
MAESHERYNLTFQLWGKHNGYIQPIFEKLKALLTQSTGQQLITNYTPHKVFC